MKKKFLVLLATITMLLLFGAANASAEIVDSGSCGDSVTYTLDDAGKLTISGTGAMYDYSNPYDRPWFSDRNKISSVVIENGVTSIGNDAFYNCPKLTNVTIGNSVKSIGRTAFCLCSNLTSITIPNSVKSIGDLALNSTGLTSITIPDSVTYIGENAFGGCHSLTDVKLSKNIVSIEAETFRECDSLVSIDIPEGVTSIKENAFRRCSILTNITIPSSVTSIGEEAFYYNWYTYDLNRNIYITDLTKWCGIAIEGSWANPMYESDATLYLNGEPITHLVIPSGITEIGEWQFTYCTGLTSVTIPESVTSIGENAFSDCTNLSSVTIPDGVTSIGGGAFSGCTGLTSITIPDGVTSIGNSAFSGCTGLTSITIPNGVTSIGNSAFSGCTGLTTVNYNATNCTSMGSYGFNSCSALTTVNIGYNVTNIPSYAFKDCGNLESITIPDSVTSIGNSAFSGCTGLTNITIPDNVTSIGDSAFSGCTGLTRITIGKDVTSIGDGAFSGCSNVITLNYNAVNLSGAGNLPSVWEINIGDAVETIPNIIFADMRNLLWVKMGDKVSKIGEAAFWGCGNLKRIYIPSTTTEIEASAFKNCDGIKAVEYGGSEEDWKAISISETGNDCLINANKNYNSSPENAEQSVDYLTYTINDQKVKITDCLPIAVNIEVPEEIDGLPVTSLGKEAFRDCTMLKSVTIPDSVTEMDHNMFLRCPNLESVVLGNGITSTGQMCFCACPKLESVTLGNKLRYLHHKAFQGCTVLTSLTIPKTVTNIGNYTFDQCGLEKIYYEGTEEEWDKIIISETGNDVLNNVEIICLGSPSDTDPSPKPSDNPSPDPSDDPSPKPSDDPSPKPSDDPSPKPSDDPKETPNPEAHQVDITRVIKTDTAIVLDAALDTAIDNTSIYAAVYDENGCLIKVKKVTPSETGKTRVEIERSASEDTVKVMAWTDGLIPVAKTDEVNLSDYDEVYYSQDYEADGVAADWTTSLAERYTPQIMTASDGNKYLGVNQAERYNNGTTLTSKDISYSGKTYAFEFDAKLMSSDDQTETELTINSPAGVLLKLNEADNRTTSWILNDDINIDLPETASVRPEDEENIDDSIIDAIPWYHFKLLSDMGAVYVSVSDEDGDEILALTQLDSAVKTLKGLKNMTFKTSRYYSNFGIDNVIIRPLTAEELELAPPPEEPVDEPIVKNSFDAATGAIMYLKANDQDPDTSVEGLTLYMGTRKSGAESSVSFAYATGGRTGNALVLNSGKFVSDNRGPRFKINTPDMTDVSELVAELYVKPVDGSDGEAALYYNDSNTAQATTKLALTTDEWNKLTIRLKKDGGQVTRTIYVNDAEKASDKVAAFPVFWGTAKDGAYSKLYFDDLTIRAVE